MRGLQALGSEGATEIENGNGNGNGNEILKVDERDAHRLQRRQHQQQRMKDLKDGTVLAKAKEMTEVGGTQMALPITLKLMGCGVRVMVLVPMVLEAGVPQKVRGVMVGGEKKPGSESISWVRHWERGNLEK